MPYLEAISMKRGHCKVQIWISVNEPWRNVLLPIFAAKL